MPLKWLQALDHMASNSSVALFLTAGNKTSLSIHEKDSPCIMREKRSEFCYINHQRVKVLPLPCLS
jgi:hypothetical protein